jgi:hypothetical protein
MYREIVPDGSVGKSERFLARKNSGVFRARIRDGWGLDRPDAQEREEPNSEAEKIEKMVGIDC